MGHRQERAVMFQMMRHGGVRATKSQGFWLSTRLFDVW
jgi:hypothetical protein